MGDIIDKIWDMPWYEVLVIAIADDVILITKLWWLYVIFIVIALISCFFK